MQGETYIPNKITRSHAQVHNYDMRFIKQYSNQ